MKHKAQRGRTTYTAEMGVGGFVEFERSGPNTRPMTIYIPEDLVLRSADEIRARSTLAQLERE